MLRVGLTGGIATGKTRVLRRMADAGFRTLDLDSVSRRVMAPGGAAYDEVVAAFGPSVVAAGGAIDRAALGRIVFADAVLRRKLEAIVHPRVRDAEAALTSAVGAGDVVVVDAALLVETGSHLRYDRLAVVHCEPQEQLCRLMARDGITEAAARARIDSQMPVDEKRGFGHHVIDTTGTVEQTDARADEVILAIRTLAAQPGTVTRISPETATTMMERGPHEGPRGLTPWTVAESIAGAGTLDLARLASMLAPPHDGPWYLAPLLRSDHPPEALAVAVALWAAARRPADPPFTIAAAASLGRLTHREGHAVSGAILAALAAQHVLAGGDVHALGRAIPAWSDAATEWTGSPPPTATVDTVAAAAAHPGDREAAARTAQIAGGLPPLARALAGGPSPAPAADRRRIVERILSRART